MKVCQELDVSGRTSQWGGDDVHLIEPEVARRFADLLHDLLAHGGIADDAPFADVFRARLELGLDKHDALGTWGKNIEEWWKDGTQGNKGAVCCKEGGALPQVLWLQVAHVTALHHHDAWILPERPRQLTVADIHGKHSGRAVLEKAVGESTRRGAGINACLAFEGRSKRLDGCEQLVPAAAHKALLRNDFQRSVDGESEARLVEALAIRPENLSGLNESLGFGAGDTGLPLYQDIQPFFFQAFALVVKVKILIEQGLIRKTTPGICITNPFHR